MTRKKLQASTMLVVSFVGMTAMGGPLWAVNPWERWESVLTSGQSLTPLQAYHDVQVEATFWLKSGSTCTEPATCTNVNTCFKGLAFWDGDATTPGRFMIRSAFPPSATPGTSSTWCWKTCLLPRNGAACSPDTGLNKSGEVPVSGSGTNALYSNGFLKAPAGKRNLTYWNGQAPFQWLGDTAWNAPVNYGLSSANRTTWQNYVTTRGTVGFTNVLVAPAVQTQQNPPSGGFRGFVAPSNCGTGTGPVVPANCHYWDSAYWRDFDAMVRAANDAGILLVVADVMDPLNRAGTNQQISPTVLFPKRADAAAFARNLAARLAGSFVIFSPSFDSRVSDSTAEAGITVAGLIDTVGTAIRSAAPRHLIGVHLAGGSALSDYDQFQGKPWLSLQVFQSGHGSAACETGLFDDYAKFACRARDFALRFRCVGETTTAITSCANSGAPANQPKKAASNVEGKYETIGDSLTRVQSRHVAWNGGLSGSFGYNIGVWPDIAAWSNPTAYTLLNHYSDDDLGRMKGLFKSMPWSDLTPYYTLLAEQNNFSQGQCGGKAKADWLQLWKPHLAMDITNGYGLAYLPRPTSCALPNNGGMKFPTTSIVFDRAKLNAAKININCTNTKGRWVSPGSTVLSEGGFTEADAGCSQSDSQVTFSVKTNNVACGEVCDRVLKLTRTSGSWQNSPNITAGSSMVDLEPQVELSEDGLTSTILGQPMLDGEPMGDPVPLSGPDPLFRKLPSAALEAEGNFLVVWEEEGSAGTDDIVAARFDSDLETLEPPFMLNDTTDGQQAEPWVSSDDSGDTVVVWTSYNEDDELAGDIYGKILDDSGEPLESEFLVSTDTEGNQLMPQVQMDGDGGFVVAWTDEESPDETSSGEPTSSVAGVGISKKTTHQKEGGVYFRIFGATGRPHGSEKRVDTGNHNRARLSRLEVHRHGGFKIRWRELDASGRDLGEKEKEHDREGNPSGGQ
jgi:Protein of unknown function (DUF4038)